MDFVSVILIIVVIYLLLQQQSTFNSKIAELESSVRSLGELIKRQDQPKPVQPEVKPATPEKPREVVAPPVREPQREVISAPREVVRPTRAPIPPRREPEPSLSFFERYPDLEKFIGENLVNKIGIAILVLSIAYFVKYAIDSNWIGPVGRVGIGILCGGIIIGFAHRLRNSYKAFSSVLVGGGLAVFYFTITLAFHQFNLFDQLAALIILIVITAFAVSLSLLYDRQELAVIALVGGFSSPFMVSTGSANYSGLFLYLLVLNAGLLIIAYYKSWRILNITSFALTVIVFAVVLNMLSGPTYYIGFIYASIFYLLFFAVNIAYNLRENKSFIASDFSILLINTALYFSVGLYLLTEMGLSPYRGLFTLCLGFVNLCLSYVLFRNRKVDTNVLYLLIGITLTFVSLTAPIQLKGNHITLFWASEAVLLYWLYLKSGIKLIRYSSLLIWVAMMVSILMDWQAIYSRHDVVLVLANKGFITTLFAALSTYLLSLLVKKENTEHTVEDFKIPDLAFSVSALALLFLAGLFEVNYQFNTRFTVRLLNILYLALYVPAFISVLNFISSRLQSAVFSPQVKLGLNTAVILFYFTCTPAFFTLQADILLRNMVSGNHFIAHWISAILIAVLFYQIVSFVRVTISGSLLTNVTWVICASIVLFLSLDLSLASTMLFYSGTNSIDKIEQIYVKTGLPVLWGLSSFCMMWLGMRHKIRTLRIISLSLFTLTLLKLFLFDIRNIPPTGKIVAFFCLGIILLTVSFMYQKVKKIIVADEENS